jgi:hypothetical protein
MAILTLDRSWFDGESRVPPGGGQWHKYSFGGVLAWPILCLLLFVFQLAALAIALAGAVGIAWVRSILRQRRHHG